MALDTRRRSIMISVAHVIMQQKGRLRMRRCVWWLGRIATVYGLLTPLASLPILQAKSSRSGASTRVLSLRFSTSEKSLPICSWRSDSRATRLWAFTRARVTRDGVTPAELSGASEEGVTRVAGPVTSELRANSNGICNDGSGHIRGILI